MQRREPTARIERALAAVAGLVEVDVIYLPILERLHAELAAARPVDTAKVRRARSYSPIFSSQD